VWKMTIEGRNRFGQYGAWWSVNDVDRLVADPHLCTLLSWLKAHNGPGRQFLVADGLRNKFGWPRRQLTKARQRAIDGGWIVQASAPRRGHAAAYVWGPAAKRANQGAGKKIGSAPNGGKRRPIEAAIMKSLGVRAGVADLVLVHAACMFALELKTEDGRPTAVQMHVCHQEAREPHGFEGAGIRSSYRTSTLRSRRMGARALLTT